MVEIGEEIVEKAGKRKGQVRAWEFFERARAARQNAPDLGAKHSHSSGYGEHLQQRAGVFWRDERA
jgi:hypothetical protein